MNAKRHVIDVDPITLEIVRNALNAIADRIATRMIRSANSYIIKEMEDASAALFDGRGRLIAESATVPILLHSTGVCLKTVLQHYFPPEAWRPGDVVLFNDPYAGEGSMSTAHTNDFVAFYPVFWQGSLVAFTTLMVHHLDIGATWMGTRGWGVEIYQEGFRVPPLKLVEEGRLDDKIMRFMLNNTRAPETLENDIVSQLSSVQAAGEDVLALFRKYGTEMMTRCFDELIDYSERRTRAEIEKIPDGVYTHEEPVLDDGAKGGPYWLRVKVIKQGSDITFDFTGTDAQVPGPINSPLGTTWPAVFYVMRCITDPSIPSNEGCKPPIHVIAPPATLVNAQKPAAVFLRMIVCHSLIDLIMGALSDAVPDRVMGDSSGLGHNYTILTDPQSGRQVMFGETVPGGMGATSRGDGINVMSCHITNCPIPPMEAIEMESPVLYLRCEFREDTGGAGRWRGGVGHVLSYRALGKDPRLHRISQKSRSLPQGCCGGLPGEGGRFVINEGTPEERVLEFTVGELEPYDGGGTVTQYGPSGGGYGAPHEREPWRVQADVRAGLVSLETAEHVYGVRLDPKTNEIVAILRQSGGTATSRGEKAKFSKQD